MQIFLVQSHTEFAPNEFIKVKFNGQELRTYLNGTLTDMQKATVGDCFYVQPNGMKKKPTVTKAVMPDARGKKIAWSLSFVGDKKFAGSYNEFFSKLYEIENIEGKENVIFISSKTEAYAFAFVKTEKKHLKPVLAFVKDSITQKDLEEMLDNFQNYRPIFCPRDFLNCL